MYINIEIRNIHYESYYDFIVYVLISVRIFFDENWSGFWGFHLLITDCEEDNIVKA